MKIGTKVRLKGTKRTGVVFDWHGDLVYVLWNKGIGCWSWREQLKVIS